MRIEKQEWEANKREQIRIEKEVHVCCTVAGFVCLFCHIG